MTDIISRDHEMYWKMFITGAILFFPLDLITTYLARLHIGSHKEYNPIMKYLLGQDIIFMILFNIVILGISIILFHFILQGLDSESDSMSHIITYTMLEFWLSGFIAFGFLLVMNNTIIIFTGVSPIQIIISSGETIIGMII